jgi:hypothetical protein
VASSSSAKKVAKLAQQGRGKKVRFQGGTTFPLVVAGIIVVGLLGLTYARLSGPGDGEGSPSAQDHWHHAFGIYVCDTYLPDLLGEKLEREVVNGNERFVNTDFGNTGIHSHDDGVIHYHPNSARATGNRATVGVYLDVYDIAVTEDSIELPEDQVAAGEQRLFNEASVKADPQFAACKDDDLQVKLVVWDNFADHGNRQDFTTGFEDARIRKDGMIFVLALVPGDKTVPVPGWACELPELGVTDGGSEAQATGNDCGTLETTTTSMVDGSTPASEPTGTEPTVSEPTSTDPVESTPSTEG